MLHDLFCGYKGVSLLGDLGVMLNAWLAPKPNKQAHNACKSIEGTPQMLGHAEVQMPNLLQNKHNMRSRERKAATPNQWVSNQIIQSAAEQQIQVGSPQFISASPVLRALKSLPTGRRVEMQSNFTLF